MVRVVFACRNDARVTKQIKPRNRRRASEKGFHTMLVERGHIRRQHGLFVENVLPSALLKQSRQFGGREIAFGGTDALVVAPAGGPMHVEPARSGRQD